MSQATRMRKRHRFNTRMTRIILLISFLAAAAPCASTVTQMSHLYGHNGEYASLINVVSTLLCVITMPVMVYLFQI